MWKTIKSLKTDRKEDRSNEVLVVDNKELNTDREKAKSFMKHYAGINTIELTKEEKERKKANFARLKKYVVVSKCNKKFAINEIDKAFEQIFEKKKGGYGDIEPAMLKNMSEEIKTEILETYNNSWEGGIVSGQWKNVIIISLLKANKDPSLRESYRPVNETLNKWQAGSKKNEKHRRTGFKVEPRYTR